MARGNNGLPKPQKVVLHKPEILELLKELDNDTEAKDRVLAMEIHFRKMIDGHVNSLISTTARFSAYKTNPFVLLIYCYKSHYSQVSQIEGDILPAKLFSSMETSAGKMAEIVTFPIYGWQISSSSMHSANSALDGLKVEGDVLKVATLKSGPRCLNDEMSENFADAIIGNVVGWAKGYNVKEVDFTYGVLYGTQSQSNKKDWHILRNLMDKLPSGSFEVLPKDRWDCTFNLDGIKVKASIKIGADWWQYIGGRFGLLEVIVAMIRATIVPGSEDAPAHSYLIKDLKNIVSTESLSLDYNVSILQRSQMSWLYLILAHYCDSLQEGQDLELFD